MYVFIKKQICILYLAGECLLFQQLMLLLNQFGQKLLTHIFSFSFVLKDTETLVHTQ